MSLLPWNLQPQRIRIMLIAISAALGLWFGLITPSAAAETRTVTAEGEYRLGNHDTKEDGIRLATEEAKRHALDQVASYLEGVTVVKNLDVTQDDIRSYTAGVVLIQSHRVALRLEGDTVIVHVDLTAQVDTGEVVQALAAVKQHEAARQELRALREELDQLHHELQTANERAQAAATLQQARTSSKDRNDILSRAQSDAMVAQAWTDWLTLTSSLTFPFSYTQDRSMPHVQALIAAAGRLHPGNPHVDAVQQALATHSPMARTPPVPQVPHTVPLLPRMPTYQVVPRSPGRNASSAALPEDTTGDARRDARHLRNDEQSSTPSPTLPHGDPLLTRPKTLYTLTYDGPPSTRRSAPQTDLGSTPTEYRNGMGK